MPRPITEKSELSGKIQHEHSVGRVFADELRGGLARAAAGRQLPAAAGSCPHGGKSVSDPPAIDVEGTVVEPRSRSGVGGLDGDGRPVAP